MGSAIWFAIIGFLFIVMTLVSATLKRLPLTSAIVYLFIGVLLGNEGFRIISLDPLKDASLVRLLTEIAVIVSLFTAGLKLRLPWTSSQWKVPLRLATVSMLTTVLLVAAVAFWGLKLPLGAALLLGSILAPTDPVLASSVQVLGPEDRDRLRFSLTAEAGLNDGIAYPFAMLGLGLLGLRDIGDWGLRWAMIDLFWGVLGGLLIGTFLAIGVGKLVAYLRTRHEETESYDDFLAIGLIGLSYGLAVLLHACGFLAVFAAGLALRRIERRESHRLQPAGTADEHRIRSETVSAHMARAVLRFNEQIERIGELGIVILAGALLSRRYFAPAYLWMVPALFLVIRPLSVFMGVRSETHSHRVLISWFGIRGIGPIYYLAFAIEKGLPERLTRPIVGVTLLVVVTSILLHGLSAAPLMLRYSRSSRSSGSYE